MDDDQPDDQPDDLLLRPATLDDVAIADVHLAARRAAPMPDPIHDDSVVRDWLVGRLRSQAHGGPDEIWVAEADGVVVGYARLERDWLDDLYVAPSHAGRGVGSALLELAKAERPGGFRLWVFESNTPAQAFYRGRGLVDLHRTDGADNMEREPDLQMAWPGRDPLAFLRGLLDDADVELGDLLARRVALTHAVQVVKAREAATEGVGRDLAREREVAARVAERVPALGAERTGRVMDTVISESLDALR